MQRKQQVKLGEKEHFFCHNSSGKNVYSIDPCILKFWTESSAPMIHHLLLNLGFDD